MTRDSRMMSGIILITVPRIQYGGYFLLTSLVNKAAVTWTTPSVRISSAPVMPMPVSS